ncbi:unnamed protein product [Leptidea sinapis]|uniref:Phorbol-ester/DAG-type domain-containing protein n=1 Tax=Leptidea sinapis TaxID=189913 RepID=A0A5E4R531_9NEOP|nr:unnamed protein product [Leptidea sinapis]
MVNYKCSSCGKFLSTADGARCISCNSLCHKQCSLNLSPNAKQAKWQCKTCQSKTVEALNSENACMEAEQQKDDSSVLAREMRLLREEISAFRSELSRLTNVVDDCCKRLDGVEARISKLEQHTSNETQSAVSVSVENLQRRLNECEQEGLLNDLDITGIPENSGENTVHLVLTLAQKIGVDMDESDIAARVRRGVDTSGIVAQVPTRRVYVNERLTQYNRFLFYLARQQGNEKKWRFIWTRGGRVYVRRDSKAKSFNIRSEEDISKVFGCSPV